MIDIQELAVFKLGTGDHESAEEGVCAMEAVAWLGGLPHSDGPECTCPVIAAYVRCLNDRLPDGERQKLVPYLPRLVGTVSKAHEQERAEYLAWQAIRVFAPAALRAVGLNDHAKRLEGAMTLKEAERLAQEARKAAYDAAAAAYAAASAAASASAAAAAAYAAAAAAAYAAASAAAYADIWPLAFNALDGVLTIGPSGTAFSQPVAERVAAYRELIGA